MNKKIPTQIFFPLKITKQQMKLLRTKRAKRQKSPLNGNFWKKDKEHLLIGGNYKARPLGLLQYLALSWSCTTTKLVKTVLIFLNYIKCPKIHP